LIHSVDLLVLIIFFVVQSYITWKFLRWSARRWTGIRLLTAELFICGAGLVLMFGYLLTYSWLFYPLHVPQRFEAYFVASTLLYLIVAGGGAALREIVRFFGKRWNAEADPGRRRVLELASNIAVAAPATVLGYGVFIQRIDFRVREIDIHMAGLATDLDGLRILQLSDIHRGPFLSDHDLGRVIDASRQLRPNVAVVTGDLISSQGDPLDSCIRQLSRLKADAGIFGCMGNHERYAGAEKHTEIACARVGIPFLRGQAQSLRFGNATFNLAGVDYQLMNDDQGYLRGAEHLVAPGAFNVLMSHNPDVFPVAARQGYNLLLAGHTHGGQVTVEILDESINPARFFTPYVYGPYRLGDAAAYVTRGIGTIGLPARIGAPPEIALIRLRKA
jgi:predicted MPP superfamily phosphohydrolase